MRREIEHGIASAARGASASGQSSNGFVNRRSPVQSRAPAQDSRNSREVAETWRPIPRAPGYEASTRGRIRRAGRRPLKPRPCKDGYLAVDVAADGRPARTIQVHTLVAVAFHGPCPPGYEVDHVRGRRSDNRPHRLEYVTHRENCRRRDARSGRSR